MNQRWEPRGSSCHERGSQSHATRPCLPVAVMVAMANGGVQADMTRADST
jgi:hypothetical protein